MNNSIKELAKNHCDLQWLSGSRLYGTNRSDSDYDQRGFIVPPIEYIIGSSSFECIEFEGDFKVYSLKRFIDLVLKGDPQLTESFFVPKSHIVRITPLGQSILNHRSLFISNQVYSRIAGYSYSEWRKAIGVKMILDDRAKEDDDIIAWIRDKKHWDKDRMDEFVSWMDEDKSSQIVPSQKNLGEKRKKEFEKYGFGVSNAAHCLRLLGEVIELMTTGDITFPRPNADLLLKIRQGKYTKEEVTLMHDELEIQAETSRNKSILPDRPDRDKVMDLYKELIISFLKKNS